MAKSQKFEDYIRLSLQMFGEEMIRRSKELKLGGLDACTNIHISYDIPSLSDLVEFPTFQITFECFNHAVCNGVINVPVTFNRNKEEK